MRHLTLSLLASAALLAGAASAEDPPNTSSGDTTAQDQPVGTVDLTGGSVAAGVGFVWGKGALTFMGEKHQLKLSGVSIVDVGAAHITATGDVFNLKNIHDFDGNYTTVTAGLTVAGGGSVAVLRNAHGVVIKLHATTQGLRFNLSADGVTIKLQG